MSCTRRFRTRTRTRRRIEEGQCGGLDCFSPPAPSPIPTSSIPSGLWCLTPFPGGPGVGQSLGPAPGQSMCSPRGWIRAGVTRLESGAPCTSCPGCLPHPNSRMLGTATPLPSTGMFSGCSLGQGSVQGLPDTAPGVLQAPPFPPPALHPGQPPCVEGQPGHSKHSPGFQRCPSSSLSFNSQGRGSWGTGGVGAAGAWSRPHTGAVQAAPWAGTCENKGKELPWGTGTVWEQLPHSVALVHLEVGPDTTSLKGGWRSIRQLSQLDKRKQPQVSPGEVYIGY